MHLFVWLVLTAVSLTAAPLSKGERQRLRAHFHLTEQELTEEVSRLSRKQLEFRAAPGT
jgi:hypothetical protein